ncbi:glucosyltransferase [Acrasis kona]|uniref:Glucosyltransferase n=1 Tax=Acrasis kona TaxID=1008807 RepID=A0AAW2ZBT5_9EUKA
MSRIAVTSLSYIGHIHPASSIGAEMKSRGHQDYGKIVESAGLEYIPIGERECPIGFKDKRDELLSTLSSFDAMKKNMDNFVLDYNIILNELPDLIKKHKIDLLIADSTLYAAPAVAEHCGIPFVTIDCISPVVVESSAACDMTDWEHINTWWARPRNWLSYRLVLRAFQPCVEATNIKRKGWNLHPITQPFMDETITRISQMPKFVDFPREWWPQNFHHTGPFFKQDARMKHDFPWDKLNGKPIVYASMGSLFSGSHGSLSLITQAVSPMDVQLVLTLGGQTNDIINEDLGSHVVVENAPQLDLLEKASLFITHGGQNSMLEGLAKGVPMVIIPVTSDQFGNANRIKLYGSGERLSLSGLNPELLRSTVEKVMSHESYTIKAKQAKQLISETNGLKRAADIIENKLK